MAWRRGRGGGGVGEYPGTRNGLCLCVWWSGRGGGWGLGIQVPGMVCACVYGGCGPPDTATYLAQQLRHDLDLLASAEQVPQGHTCDTRHFHIVHQHHKALEQPKRQVGILQAVHRQAAASLLIPVLRIGMQGQGSGRAQAGLGGIRRILGRGGVGWHLQVGDDAVLHILLLLTQEVEAHSIECVGAELVFPQQHLGRSGWGRAQSRGMGGMGPGD